MKNKYYVYVYIDPRNDEEFYVGMGSGSRKNAHLFDKKKGLKTNLISEIRKAGKQPVIRVIARNLSKQNALLVEKTLIWKFDKKLTNKQLTNISSGHYAENFRPHNTLHFELSEFDYQNGIYYYNVGECHCRDWDDYKKFGFISGGGKQARWHKAMKSFQKGDVVAAYLKRRGSEGGFVGIGIIKECAKPIREVKINGKPLLSLDLKCKGMARGVKSNELCEYVAKVKWKVVRDRKQGEWKQGIYTTPLVRASLDAQPKTIKFLETKFGQNLRELVI
ncbi:MAG TPA: GIY-YIG nuclease family protein [Verrucomicrobiae bacterium]